MHMLRAERRSASCSSPDALPAIAGWKGDLTRPAADDKLVCFMAASQIAAHFCQNSTPACRSQISPDSSLCCQLLTAVGSLRPAACAGVAESLMNFPHSHGKTTFINICWDGSALVTGIDGEIH